MGLSIWEGDKAGAVADNLSEISAHLSVMAKAMGEDSTGAIKSHKMTQLFVRAGTIGKYLATGEGYKVAKESGVSVTVNGSATATVNEETFIAKVGHADTYGYEFIYDGAAWHLEGEEAEMTQYGITVGGSPAEGDVIVVHVQGSEIVFDILGTNDYDVPVNSELTHTLPLISRDILSYGTIAFKPAQLMKAIASDEFPEGLPAGTHYFVCDHACYDNTTKQDGSYNFTTTQPVPVGGGIRHSEIGKYYGSSADYTTAKILAGTFTTYDADGNVIESGLATSSGASGTNLGTVTAETPSYMSGSHLNSTRRQMYGSNRGAFSNQKDWLNSSAAGAASGQVASWYQKHTEFDLPVKSTLPGFMHGLDPEFVSVLCPVRKRTYLHAWDQDGLAYEDTEETIFQLSMTEVGFGANSNVYECGVKADGTVNKAEAYPLFKDASNADRIKYEGSTARYWFLRSPHPSGADYVRRVNTTGAWNDHYANRTNGVVAGLCIG